MAGLLSGCAQRSAEPAAPASAEDRAVTSAAPAAELPPPAEAAPAAPAPAPQGLDKLRDTEAGQSDDFPDLEAAERALNQAKSDLDRLALAEPVRPVGRAGSADGASASRAEKKDAKRPAPSAAPASNAPNVCESACRAFASLSRAARAVCRLDGDSGAHCTHAKRVVSDSQSRVSSCACPAAE